MLQLGVTSLRGMGCDGVLLLELLDQGARSRQVDVQILVTSHSMAFLELKT